jgi:hypothetical protein
MAPYSMNTGKTRWSDNHIRKEMEAAIEKGNSAAYLGGF